MKPTFHWQAALAWPKLPPKALQLSLYWRQARMNLPLEARRNLKFSLLLGSLLLLLAAMPLLARTAVDFDPNLDFSKYKTFAFLGGVEHLVMLDVNLDLLNGRVHRSVGRELTKKGLREVQTGEHPDLAVRYWANASKEVNLAVLGNWEPYAPYIDSYWAPMFNDVAAASKRENVLVVDFLDPKFKNLVWRLYLIRKFDDSDKEWKKADDEFSKAFEGYPPSAKAKEEKLNERAAHPPKL
jgi:hypothetical protein